MIDSITYQQFLGRIPMALAFSLFYNLSETSTRWCSILCAEKTRCSVITLCYIYIYIHACDTFFKKCTPDIISKSLLCSICESSSA
jgi:hypothetical protein